MSIELIKEENGIVFIQKDNVFTNSQIIADELGVKHHAIQQITDKYKSDFEEFGILNFSHSKSQHHKRGRPNKIYEFNKEQALLLFALINCSINLKKHIIKNIDKDTLPTMGIKENKKGYVYILEWSNKLIKIGRTKNPYKRIEAIRTQSPVELKQTYISEEISNYEEVEIKLHNFFSNSRKHGEYFMITFDIAVGKLKEIVNKKRTN